MDATPQRDTEFYFDTITFLVDNIIFKVPSQYIHEESEVFGAGAQISAQSDEGSSDANPVKLSPLPHGCSAEDFRHLLRIIVALTVKLPTPKSYSLEQWLSVLKLSTAWFFSDIRTLAMGEVTASTSHYTNDQWITVLDFAHSQGSDRFSDLRDLAITRISGFNFSSKVDQVLMGRKYLHKPWIIQGLRDLVNASALPSLKELTRLGQNTVLTLLYMAFQRAQSMGTNRGYHHSYSYRGPYNDVEVEEYFVDEIISLFPVSRPS
ncbi:hypothetical protein E1B28_010261 [Marasmius oreades]|uniref:Uncharacterized protein n=1 Tax=Marasmius oreades TaxID=181124 RepID=A0A9P7RWQ4_9AGAR|nr:uncharacterized protein E1B28_010261 [Marasmius oreades]KAG7091209.1 hypothetical protein E1B28_010261 [Marasmius oreades]